MVWSNVLNEEGDTTVDEKLIERGVYAVSEAMPCEPQAIRVPHYFLPGTLERSEREEAAARVLSFSQQFGQWVGVSWRRIGEVVMRDLEAFQRSEKVRKHNFNEQRRAQEEKERYDNLCFWTLGIYWLFADKPAAANLLEVPNEKIPHSGMFMFGPQHILDGFIELAANGMLRKVTEGEGDDANDIFFPTSQLVSRVMERQRVTVSE
jgi:hypothetical protein